MSERLDRIESQLEALTNVVGQYIEHNETERRETNAMLQSFIDDGKADRAESQRQRAQNEREHQAFREQFQQLLGQLVARINEIWQRLNAA